MQTCSTSCLPYLAKFEGGKHLNATPN